MKRTILVSVLILALWAFLSAEIPNAGFEEGARSWTLPPTARVVTGVAGAEGQSCLLLEHGDWQASEVASAPLELKVGQPYRVKIRVRTEGLVPEGGKVYPTPLGFTLSMASQPFTLHSAAAVGDGDWTDLEFRFWALAQQDRVVLRLGTNGRARGRVWVDQVQLSPVEAIGEMVPLETVRWEGPAFRVEDQGWIFVHIEGEPWERGRQYGRLMAREMAAYADKLAIDDRSQDPAAGWENLRRQSDALFMRGFDTEYLEEMKGMADGAKAAGVKADCFSGRDWNLLDVVTLNSVIDLGQLDGALDKTPTAISRKAFAPAEQEMDQPQRTHKCSAFLANGPLTPNGEIVFSQMFMWGGYTGVHWNVICDVQPTKGHRLVFESFPGGIHSGADFYVNEKGIMLGETTVRQTPFDISGTPQANRIRRAAQYASSIDDVVRIMTARNNGLYTNDWLIGDAGTGETAILLLGTHRHKLWRSSRKEWYRSDMPGFYWSVNNAKDMGVCQEYLDSPENSPYDLVFSPSNRDLAFQPVYETWKGKLDAAAGARIVASSPINRSHACDSKITTSAMARELMLMAHFGKTTHRSKIPGESGRLMPDLPGATPHLALGYSVFSPRTLVSRLQAEHQRLARKVAAPKKLKENREALKERDLYAEGQLWRDSIFPASDADNWLVSGGTAYWWLLRALVEDQKGEGLDRHLEDALAQLLYTLKHEGPLAPKMARRSYEDTRNYRIPRIRGLFALHQLRLHLGNEAFAKGMGALYRSYTRKPVTTRQALDLLNREGGAQAAEILRPWMEREDLPLVTMAAQVQKAETGYRLKVELDQETPYRLVGSLTVETRQEKTLQRVVLEQGKTLVDLELKEKPVRVVFNETGDIPLNRKNDTQFGNLFEDFSTLALVYGTSREEEAGQLLAHRFATVLADTFTETVPEVLMDSAMNQENLKDRDFMVLGGLANNSLLQRLPLPSCLSLGQNHFFWQGALHGEADEGLVLSLPNPWNPKRVMTVILANSALQLYEMTRRYTRGMAGWNLFRGGRLVSSGHHRPDGLDVKLP